MLSGLVHHLLYINKWKDGNSWRDQCLIIIFNNIVSNHLEFPYTISDLIPTHHEFQVTHRSHHIFPLRRFDVKCIEWTTRPRSLRRHRPHGCSWRYQDRSGTHSGIFTSILYRSHRQPDPYPCPVFPLSRPRHPAQRAAPRVFDRRGEMPPGQGHFMQLWGFDLYVSRRRSYRRRRHLQVHLLGRVNWMYQSDQLGAWACLYALVAISNCDSSVSMEIYSTVWFLSSLVQLLHFPFSCMHIWVQNNARHPDISHDELYSNRQWVEPFFEQAVRVLDAIGY